MYAELNPSLNYNRGLPDKSSNNFEETPAFSKYQKMKGSEKTFEESYCGGGSSMAIRGMQMENTPVSLLFFSDENRNRIQKKIRKEVYRLSKGTFKLEVDQDESDLLVAMRAVFFGINDDTGARNLPTHIVKQVKILNEKTINYIVPDMITNIKQHYGYLKDINEPRNIMPQPLNVNKRSKTLPSFTSVWQ
jgi:hypothetical protein